MQHRGHPICNTEGTPFATQRAPICNTEGTHLQHRGHSFATRRGGRRKREDKEAETLERERLLPHHKGEDQEEEG